MTRGGLMRRLGALLSAASLPGITALKAPSPAMKMTVTGVTNGGRVLAKFAVRSPTGLVFSTRPAFGMRGREVLEDALKLHAADPEYFAGERTLQGMFMNQSQTAAYGWEVLRDAAKKVYGIYIHTGV